jgi:hypothetical protein
MDNPEKYSNINRENLQHSCIKHLKKNKIPARIKDYCHQKNCKKSFSSKNCC